jgi:hypothetical protein
LVHWWMSWLEHAYVSSFLCLVFQHCFLHDIICFPWMHVLCL